MKEQSQKISNGDTKKEICDDHGEYYSTCSLIPFGSREMKRWSSCPECEKKWIAKDKARKEKERVDTLNKMLSSAGITKRFFNCSFDNFQVTKKNKFNFDTISRYLNKFSEIKENGTSMILCGSPGTGKTHLACALVSELTKTKEYIKYITLYKMIAEIKSTYSKFETETDTNIINKYSTCALLVVDEIGVQFGSETEKVLFYQIINGRYENMLPTILISNLNKDGVKKSIGDRCFDRLKEGKGVVLSFDWESYRK